MLYTQFQIGSFAIVQWLSNLTLEFGTRSDQRYWHGIEIMSNLKSSPMTTCGCDKETIVTTYSTINRPIFNYVSLCGPFFWGNILQHNSSHGKFGITHSNWMAFHYRLKSSSGGNMHAPQQQTITYQTVPYYLS